MLVRALSCSFRLQMRGIHDLVREKPYAMFMLLWWRSICVASLMMQSVRLNSLARVLTFWSCRCMTGFWGCKDGCVNGALWPSSHLNIHFVQCIHMAFLGPGHLCWAEENWRVLLVGGNKDEGMETVCHQEHVAHCWALQKAISFSLYFLPRPHQCNLLADSLLIWTLSPYSVSPIIPLPHPCFL
jgi:hypothetical protein